VIAIILAGGKSSRMRRTAIEPREKALISIGAHGKENRLIELVVASVKDSAVDDFLVAVTKSTPRTAAYSELMEYKTLETPGDGYVEDLWFLLARYPEFVSVVCDAPFVKSEHINAVIEAYHVNRVSITGAVPLDLMPQGVTPGHVFEYKGQILVSCGLNVVTTSVDSIPFVFTEPRLAINVNTDEELRVARSMLE
jgi:adenosylcobinamide-phosphate guanylyltransferase